MGLCISKKVGSVAENCGNRFFNYIIAIIISPHQQAAQPERQKQRQKFVCDEIKIL
jgi:hypothetical protein